MPPFGFRKRERSASPKPQSNSEKAIAKQTKPTLFETADAPSKGKKSLEENEKFLQQLDGDEDDEDESLSEVDSDEFEDVPPSKRRKVAHADADEVEDAENEDDEMEWEDAIQQDTSSHATPAASKPETEITDISISMNDDGTYIEPLVSAATGKKGPSKRERQIRVQAHCLHVQSLMWHNTIRNSWLNDKEVEKLLLDGFPGGVQREVQQWKKAMGTPSEAEVQANKATDAKGKAKRGKKGKQKSTGRDWNEAAVDLEPGVAGSDPLLRLLKVLTAYWRKRFTVTAPALRKQGHKPLRRLRDEVRAWEKNHQDPEEFGERIESIAEFRLAAKNCEGSRDVGAQLFVALLRGLGLETRMVANLQPIGFGWSKAEEANPKKSKKEDDKIVEIQSESEDEDPVKSKALKKASSSTKAKQPQKPKNGVNASKPTRRSSRGNKSDPINLDDSDSPLSSPPSEPEDFEPESDDDDISIIDVTPSTPKRKIPLKKYDRDMAFPNYWTEVCSPVSHKYYPVDPIVLSTIASNDELLSTFEPRGKKAEKAKQVMCYTVGFSSDGTAKDVTVRYLKRHQLPGKTKGMRIGVEKIPIYNRNGKVKKYEEYDWFKTVMLIYERPDARRTAADDLEEQTVLKPYKPAKEEKEVAKESLAGYKQSADYVLEQHLRREEAILPGSEPVKYFTAGKGDKTQEVPVYSRDDIVVCKTVETWHKEGRAVKIGEQPMKYVPMRAVTLVRKREMEDAQRETGEKMKQGLYSEAQTDWIIPPPIQNGVIPKNAFGNMDVYVPTMVPQGAIHLPLKGSAKLCRKLEIDYAEACTGFEFGKQRAVPVLTGVVVAQENAAMVRDAWRAEQQEIKRKEDTKRTATSLHWWRKMLLGLRVLERMKSEYLESGGNGEDINPFIRKAVPVRNSPQQNEADNGVDEEMSGGFFLPGHDEEEVPRRGADRQSEEEDDDQTGGVLLEDEDGKEYAGGGGFLVEDDPDDIPQQPPKGHAPITPVSLQSIHKTMDGAADSDDDAGDTNGNYPNNRQPRPIANSLQRVQSRTSAKTRAKPQAKRKTMLSSDEDEQSSLSELSESEDSETEDDDDSTSPNVGVTLSSSKREAPSPRVVVKASSRPRNHATKKSTPVRSQYFTHSGGAEGNDGAESSDAEVVKPRKTTLRTRARS